MKTKNTLKEQIDHVLNIGEAIDPVKASPFFKEKMMNRLFDENIKEEKIIFEWFTPKLQLASLACIIILNIAAFTNVNSTSYEESISEFAESYGLVTTEENSLFN